MSSTLATSTRCTDIQTVSSFVDDESGAEVRPLLPKSFTARTPAVHLSRALATNAMPDVPPLILQFSIQLCCDNTSEDLELSPVRKLGKVACLIVPETFRNTFLYVEIASSRRV